jgi:ketosteroid isomerase-like protein
MNKFLTSLIIIISSILAACQEPAPVDTEEADLAVVQRMYDAFAVGDVETVVAAMAEDIVWNEAENFPYADGNPYVGSQAIVEGVFGRIVAEWDYWELDLQDKLQRGNRMVFFGRYNAKHKESGKTISAQFVHLWEVVDGKAASFQQYADTAQVLAALQSDTAK